MHFHKIVAQQTQTQRISVDCLKKWNIFNFKCCFGRYGIGNTVHKVLKDVVF